VEDPRVSELSGVHVFAREGVPIVRLEGEIDLSNADGTFAMLSEVADGDAPALILDLSGLGYLDSAGVRLLFRLARSVVEDGGTLLVVVPHGAPVRRVLELADAPRMFGLEQTEEDALARLRASS
jgi:anti-anti-sigma factor